jgi:hypothetical protein
MTTTAQAFFHSVLERVKYKDWRLHIGSSDGRAYLQWVFTGLCVKTKRLELQHCRKWFLSEHMTESELVQTAFAAALAAEEHECREFFSYQGCRLFQPHVSVHALMAACAVEDARKPMPEKVGAI